MSLHRFWLIRHALVHPAALTCLYGVNDVPICEVTMATDAPRYAALAALLPRPARLIATPLSRTQLTAAALFRAGYPRTRLELEADFVEQDFGDFQGRPIGDFEDRPAHERHPFWPIHAAETPPNGESFEAMIRRVGGALERLAAAAEGDFVVFSHGGAIRAACAHALGLTPHQALSLAVENVSLTRLDRNEAGWRLVSLNEHLAQSSDNKDNAGKPAQAHLQEGATT